MKLFDNSFRRSFVSIAAFAIGAVSGGGLVACGSNLSRLAGAYTAIDTAAGMALATQHIAQGNVGVGDALAFLPALTFGAQKMGVLFKAQCFGVLPASVKNFSADGAPYDRNASKCFCSVRSSLS